MFCLYVLSQFLTSYSLNLYLLNLFLEIFSSLEIISTYKLNVSYTSIRMILNDFLVNILIKVISNISFNSR